MTIKTQFSNEKFQVFEDNEFSQFILGLDNKIHYIIANYKTWEYKSKCGITGRQKHYNVNLDIRKVCTKCFNLGAGQ